MASFLRHCHVFLRRPRRLPITVPTCRRCKEAKTGPSISATEVVAARIGSQEAEDERQQEAQAEALDLCEVEVLDAVEGVAEDGIQVDHKKKKRSRVVVSSDEDTESEFEEEEGVRSCAYAYRPKPKPM